MNNMEALEDEIRNLKIRIEALEQRIYVIDQKDRRFVPSPRISYDEDKLDIIIEKLRGING